MKKKPDGFKQESNKVLKVLKSTLYSCVGLTAGIFTKINCNLKFT